MRPILAADVLVITSLFNSSVPKNATQSFLSAVNSSVLLSFLEAIACNQKLELIAVHHRSS